MTTIFSARSRKAALRSRSGSARLSALAGPASADPKVLAKVDGAPITEDDVADAMADIGPGLPQKLEGAARQKYVLDYLIDLKLAAKKAEADKLTSTAGVRTQARLLSRQAGDGAVARLGRQGGDDRGGGAEGL